MGGETEDGGDAAPARSQSSSKSEAKTEPLVAKPKLDPKDFIYMKRTGEKLVKAPGTINGQQFVIDRCEDCEIYILDECDSLMIDDCVRCKIVVGPTTGSIFMRDCSDCTCVFMCRQYRCRDCKDIDTHLHVTTRPIIETSTNMRFGCWDFHYEGLEAQMRSAGISEWQNFWSHIYNFNPDDATWSLMPPERTALAALEPLPDFSELEGVAEALADGARPPPVREDPGREGLGAEGGLPYPGSRVRRPHGAGDLRHGARGEGVAGPNQQVPAHRGMGRVVSGGWRRGVSRRAVQGEGHRPRVWGRGLRGCDARGGVVGRISHAREPRPVCGVAVHGRGRLGFEWQCVTSTLRKSP